MQLSPSLLRTILAVGGLALAGNALAQDEGAAASPAANESPAPGTDGSTVEKYREMLNRRAEEAERPVNPAEPNYPGRVRPDGKTLPERVLRIRVPVNVSRGHESFDKDGKKKDLGVDVNVTATGFVAEYGLNDRTTMQLLLPYVTQNKLGVNASRFRKSQAYQNGYNDFVNLAAQKLAANPDAGCGNAEACAAAIRNGYALPFDAPFALPTGETLNVKAGVPLRDYADSIVVNTAKATKAGSGATGWGDTTVGFLYEVTNHTSPMYFSIGSGLRAPTGKFDVPEGQRATSRGIWEWGLRTNLDYDIARGWMVSWQNQMEVPVSKGKKHTASVRSLVDPDRVLVPGQVKTYERRGVRNVGFLHLKHNLGVYSDATQGLEFGVGADYNADSAERLDGKEITPRSYFAQSYASASYSLLHFKIPFEVFYEYYTPWSGKNVALATTTSLLTLRAYYLF